MPVAMVILRSLYLIRKLPESAELLPLGPETIPNRLTRTGTTMLVMPAL